MNLYKYTSAKIGKEILRNLEIRFTQPNALNDVFEMFPNILTNIPEKLFNQIFSELESSGYIESIWKTAEDSLFDSVNKNYPFLTKKITNLILKRLFKSEFLKGETLQNYLFKRIKSQPDEFKVKLIHEFLNLLNSYVGVLSLSTINDANLMWGNYADSHRGIIICFDSLHQFFKDCMEIQYVINRTSLDFNELIVENGKSDIKNIFLQKGIEWQYEHEMRTFQLLANNKRILPEPDLGGYQICLFELPKEAIKGIILGSKTSMEDKIEIENIIKSNNLEISIQQASVSSTEFKIMIH